MIKNTIDNRYLTIIYEANDGSDIQIIYECHDSAKLNYALLLVDEMDLMMFIIEDVLPYAEDMIILNDEDDEWREKIYDVYVYLSTPENDKEELIASYENMY